jgi:hypothetical protein
VKFIGLFAFSLNKKKREEIKFMHRYVDATSRLALHLVQVSTFLNKNKKKQKAHGRYFDAMSSLALSLVQVSTFF